MKHTKPIKMNHVLFTHANEQYCILQYDYAQQWGIINVRTKEVIAKGTQEQFIKGIASLVKKVINVK